MKATVTPWLDTRKAKNDSTFPVKLEVVFNQKVYRIGIGESCTLDEASTFGLRIAKDLRGDAKLITRLTNKQRSTNKRINDARLKAEGFCEAVGDKFTYEGFIDAIKPKKSHKKDERALTLFSYWENVIAEMKANGQVGTAISYESAMKKFKIWRPDLDFKDVSVELFGEFEKDMLKDSDGVTLEGRRWDSARVTVGFYCRSARTIINKAITDLKLPLNKVFGKKLYQIPGKGKRLNKWVRREDLQKVFDYPAVGKAGFYLDLFQFMYRVNGIYPSDVAFFRWSYLNEDADGKYLEFRRKKTENTTEEPEYITVKVTTEIQAIIDRRGVKGSPYMFGIINDNMDAVKKRNRQRDLVSAINTVLKRATKDLGLPHLSSKAARHSWASHADKKGIATSLISAALGHTSVETTKSYLATMSKRDADALASVAD
jgi:integrase